jgi:hypothetical protein
MHYQVESQWRTADGMGADYRYPMVFQLAKYPEKEPEKVAATFRMDNQHGRRLRPEDVKGADGIATPKFSAVVGVELAPNGPPIGLQISGETSAIAIPLLAWTLPATFGTQGLVLLDPLIVNGGVEATGTLKVLSLAKGRADLRLDYTFGPPQVPAGDRAAKATIRVQWDLRRGVVQSVEGTFEDPSGKFDFRIRKS